MSEDVRYVIARRAARLIRNGEVVNLGVGIPQLVADVLEPDREVYFQAENGVLGYGGAPPAGQEDDEMVDAGKRAISEKPGISYFHSADSFAMIRGGHVDCAIMGTLQVDQEGNIANWLLPGRPQLGVGGAMDLLAGARRVVLATTLTTTEGKPKIMKRCTLPVTAFKRAGVVVTEAATFEFQDGRLWLTDLAPGASVDDVRSRVEAEFSVHPSLREAMAR
jgi:3-oxoacid CoA-transferase B subunit